MQNSYQVDSDSDSENESEEVAATSPPSSSSLSSSSTDISGCSIADVQKLKEQTAELLDAEWKADKNRRLIIKMLELEEPSITPKMVDFLLQDGVCENFMSVITQLGSERRAQPNDPPTDALKLSYRATFVITPDEPSDAIMAFIGKRAALIARSIFDIFRDDSGGSFYHAYRILEFILRYFPAESYDGICSDGSLSDRIRSLLRYIGHPPVGEMMVMLVALTPVSRNTQLYALCSKYRWTFFEQLGHISLMLRIVEVVVNPGEFCKSNETTVRAEQHTAVAAQVLQELIEKLSLEDTGEFLLQPLGYTVGLLDYLVDKATDVGAVESQRRIVTRLLCFLLRRSADPELVCIIGPANGLPASPSYVPNRLHPLRSKIIAHLQTKAHLITQSLLAFRSGGEQRLGESVPHPGYVVGQPFSALRSLLVELLVLLVEADPTVAEIISSDLWKELASWLIEYAHNNIYHVYFFRIFFAVIRQNQESVLRVIFLRSRMLSLFIDNFVSLDGIGSSSNANSNTSAAVESDERRVREKMPPEQVRRVASRGIIMSCCNAIRLQASSLPPVSFLRQFISSNSQWATFLPVLNATTRFQQIHGMGIKIAEPRQIGNAHYLASLLSSSQETKPDNEIDLGSRFAKSLGFISETAWPIDSPSVEKKKKKKNKQKKLKAKLRLKSEKANQQSAASGNGTSSGRHEEGDVDFDDEDGEDSTGEDLEGSDDNDTGSDRDSFESAQSPNPNPNRSVASVGNGSDLAQHSDTEITSTIGALVLDEKDL